MFAEIKINKQKTQTIMAKNGKNGCNLLQKNPAVCRIKPFFDYLQGGDLRIIQPLNVNFLRDYFDLPSGNNVFLWNQLSDPHLGIHDRLAVDGSSAVFKWVLVGGKVISIQSLYGFQSDELPFDSQLEESFEEIQEDEVIEKIISYEEIYIEDEFSLERDEFDFGSVEIWHVMRQVCSSMKSIPSYFIAEGLYDGVDGIHFCLTPYNDVTSLSVIEMFYGEEFPRLLKECQNGSNFCLPYLSEKVLREANRSFLEHFMKNLV